MNKIADSDAYLDPRRTLSQHQAAITIVQGMLDNPSVVELSWLDLCCGKGQIIINLKENLNAISRAKISYNAYDINDDFLQMTLKQAKTLGFKLCNGKSGHISNFQLLHPIETKFDFISLTNSLHEFDPKDIPSFLLNSILRLSGDGVLFLYDMEFLPSYELGAVTWTFEEIHEIIDQLLAKCGVNNGYKPSAGKWKHHSVTAWNSQIQRKYLELSDEVLVERLPQAIIHGKVIIQELLERKIKYCRERLEILTEYGSENQEEEEQKIRLLYDFWSLNRYMSI